MRKEYQIIHLNGPSSAGKSTIARALQNELKEPFLLIGIDQIIYMMPEKLNDWTNNTIVPGFSWQPVFDEYGNITSYKIITGHFGERIVRALKDIVVTLVRTGHNVIVDDVSFGNDQIQDWHKFLLGFNVLWLGVTAPLEIIEQREKERGDRKIGSARWQFSKVHAGVTYDMIIDTYAYTVKENIAAIMKYIESHQ